METKDLYQLYKKHRLVTTDSRAALPHSIFFALKGENFNGNKYAEKALNSGCRYAVVDEEKYAIDDRFILVNNVLEKLQKLAAFNRQQFDIPVLAITGSNGKTTTKELVSAVLASKYKVHYTKGNLNNHIGVPLTLLSMPADTEIAVIEMGANHTGEIDFLCRIAEPNFGLITNIGKAHIEGFGSFEGVIKTKSELYRFLIKTEGNTFYSSDNEILTGLDKSKKTFSYGRKNADIMGIEINSAPYLALKWTNKPPEALPPRWAGKEKHIQTQLIGSYNLDNVLAACAIGYYFKVERRDIKNAIENYKPKNNRSEYSKTDKNELILDAYNANPSSMKAAIENFMQIETETEKMLILGDMLELGDISNSEHIQVLNKITDLGFEKVLLVGENFTKANKSIKSIYRCFKNSDHCSEYLKNNQTTNKLILIKGSRGSRLEKIVPYL